METSTWKWFRYDDVFVIKKGKRLTKTDQTEGDIPYVSSKSTNNGIDGYIANGYTDENCISFACYGCIGEVFYHSGKVWVSDNCNVIYLKNKELNANIALFLISIFYKEKYRFSYGMTGKVKNLIKLKIKLPVLPNGMPDWEFIDNFTKNTIIPTLPAKTKSVWNKSFDKKAISDKKFSLDTENWKWFKYGEIFDIKKGNTLTKEKMIKGNIPFISSTASNNGISALIDNDKHLQKGNSITVNSNGSVGYAFYQVKDYWASGDNNVLKLNDNSKLNKYVGLFLCTLIEKERYRFSYGRKWGKEKMLQHKIKLPAKNGQPDWQFMEDYIKSLPYSKAI